MITKALNLMSPPDVLTIAMRDEASIVRRTPGPFESIEILVLSLQERA